MSDALEGKQMQARGIVGGVDSRVVAMDTNGIDREGFLPCIATTIHTFGNVIASENLLVPIAIDEMRSTEFRSCEWMGGLTPQ